MASLSCFKAYDIRGKIGDDLDDALAFDLGKAIVRNLRAATIVIGRDIRASSPALSAALARGAQAAGANVKDIGLCGTEEVYFATDHLAADAGVMVTASHNPIDYNGFKIVGPGATPLPDDVFRAIETDTAAPPDIGPPQSGDFEQINCRPAYVEKLCAFVDIPTLKPVHILANAGNGCAGPTFDAICDALIAKGAPLKVTRLHHMPDASFPNGIPNPLLPENHPVTADAVRAHGADFGIAWDGDFDRCFFFDHTGDFIAGEYIVGVLARAILANAPGQRIVHDPRVMWNTQRIVTRAGGKAVVSKTGHALVKAAMRHHNAVYGGEMSAHHYFRDFMFCDSGMIPWILVINALSQSGQSLKSMIDDMRAAHPSSGEINFRVTDAKAVTQRIYDQFHDGADHIDMLDGLSMCFENWRFNLRSSNTEPLLRLNVETLGDVGLLHDKVAQITQMITPPQAGNHG